jgi:SWI/SNF-related matrix-associated actin-dependent regulator of chromatin subfamily D
MYQGLLEMEKKLDWTMNRNKVEVQDALARNPTVCFGIPYTQWLVC